MTREEMATVLRTALPLVDAPQHSCQCLRLDVLAVEEAGGGEGEPVWVEVEENGTLHSCAEETPRLDGWGRGKVETWIPAILDGDLTNVLVGGDRDMVSDCLTNLHRVLWTATTALHSLPAE